MAGIPLNPNVPVTAKTPDTYLYISTSPTTSGTPQPRNLFILAPFLSAAAALVAGDLYNLPAGTAQVNSIEQYTSQDSVNTAFGRRSLAARRFAAATQAQPIGLNIFVAAVAEPTASNYSGVATQLLTFSGTAVGSGEVKIRIAGYLHRVQVANGDAAATMASSTVTAMGGAGSAGPPAVTSGASQPQQPDCPFVPGNIISSVTVPVVHVHRGEVGNDKPIVVDIPPELTGFYISPGTITIATNGSGGSIFTIRCGSQSVSTTIANGTTPANAAIAIAANINAATFGLSAVASSTDVILKYRNGWAVHRIQVNSTEPLGGQTYTLKDRLNATNTAIDTSIATTAGSAAYTGLQGSGTPTLTTVLANKAKMVAMSEWFSEYVDSTSLGAISTHVEQYANGYYQQNQRVTFGSNAVLDVASTVTGVAAANDILGAPSPALTNYWRYEEVVAQDTFCQMGAICVELAADLCAAQLPFNFDGHYIAQGTQVPILPPRADTELDPNTVDTAMRSYYLTVAKGDNGRVKIVRGVTSWSFTNTEWADYSFGRMFDDARYRLREFLNQRFSGKVLFTATSPRVDNAFTLKDVEDAVREWMLSRDGITVDGAQSLGRFVVAEVDPDDGSFIRLAFRLRVPREAHVKSGVISSAPAAS